MKSIKLKPTQKFLVLIKDILVIHNDARKAFNIWHQFRPKTLDINMHALDDHYCQTPILTFSPNKSIKFNNLLKLYFL